MTILGTLVAGLIIGALARLIMPGNQGISILMTIVLGVLGSVAGSWISAAIFGIKMGDFHLVSFLIGIACAIALIAAYLSVKGRSSRV